MKAIRFAQPNPDSALSSEFLAFIAVVSSVSRIRNFLSASSLRSPLSVSFAGMRYGRTKLRLPKGEVRKQGGSYDIAQPNSDKRSAIVSWYLLREQSHTTPRRFAVIELVERKTRVLHTLSSDRHNHRHAREDKCVRARECIRPGQRTSAKNRPGYVINRF